MSIEAYQPQDYARITADVHGMNTAEILNDENRAMLQAALDTPSSQPLLLPKEIRVVMKKGNTNEEGSATTMGNVIPIRKYADKNLEHGSTSEIAAPRKPRRATRDTGPSPYATGDGMIIPAESSKVEPSGSVRVGTGAVDVSHRAIRGAKKLPKIDVNNYEPRGTTHRRDDIEDLIALDKTGRARYESGVDKKGRNIKGRFITTHELDMIAANQAVIRDGLAGRNKTNLPAAPEDSPKTAKLEQPAEYQGDDWDSRSEEHRKIIAEHYAKNASKTVKAELAIDQTLEQRTFGGWTKEQEAAIEYLKRPLPAGQKRTLLRTIAKYAKKTDNVDTPVAIEQPAEYQGDDWDSRSEEHRKIIAEHYAKNAKPEARVITISMKKILAATVAGALVLGAAIGSRTEHGADTPVRAAETHAQPVEDPIVKPVVKVVTAKHEKKHVDPASVRLNAGDNPWHEAEIVLGRQGINHPTDLQIAQLTNHLRAINGHMTEEQAKHLPVGYTLKLR
jgi:hypothetical protein